MEPKARLAFFLSAVFLTVLALGALLPLGATESPATHTVVIEGMAFAPAEVSAKPGDRIVFENRDLVPHTATASAPKTFDSGAIEAGATWTLTVSGAGTVSYLCQYHPTMKGRIVIGTRD